MRKTAIGGLVVAGLMGVGLGFASPAYATTLVNNGDGSVTTSGMGGGDDVYICASTVSAAVCEVSSFADNLLFVITQNGTYSEGSSVGAPPNGSGTPAPLTAGTYTMVPFTTGNAGTALLNVVIGSGGGGGGGTSSGTTSQPQPVALSINTVDGSSCRQSSESGFAGSWMNLPGADDCTAPATKPGATLLGWATTPNFPVEIAQRQIDNGWGAYETFNDEGRLTGVFIPAGGATFLSGAGNLFAIWSE